VVFVFATHSRKSDAKFPEILKWLNFQSAFAKATARQAADYPPFERLRAGEDGVAAAAAADGEAFAGRGGGDRRAGPGGVGNSLTSGKGLPREFEK